VRFCPPSFHGVHRIAPCSRPVCCEFRWMCPENVDLVLIYVLRRLWRIASLPLRYNETRRARTPAGTSA
jgi:hypothetical protein